MLNGCDKPNDSQDRPTDEQTDGGTQSQQLIDTLKCQLQQAALAQQTANVQLDAVKQVICCCYHYLHTGVQSIISKLNDL